MTEYKGYQIPNTKEEMIGEYSANILNNPKGIPNIPFIALNMMSNVSLEEVGTASEEDLPKVIDRYVENVKAFIDGGYENKEDEDSEENEEATDTESAESE